MKKALENLVITPKIKTWWISFWIKRAKTPIRGERITEYGNRSENA